jgi:putative DNA primase/helicase
MVRIKPKFKEGVVTMNKISSLVGIPKHTLIAEALKKKSKIIFYNDIGYVYKNGVYEHDTLFLENEMLVLDSTLTIHQRKEIIDYLRIKTSNNNLQINDNYINFKNCLYDIENKTKINHSPEMFTINQIQANYIENPPINNYVEAFLNDITCNIMTRKITLLQIIGYSMTSKVDLQKAFIFYGETAGNGKSTLLEVITALIGDKNISHVSIHNLQEGRFYAAELENKILNTVEELPKNHLKDIELFKDVVTGGRLSVEEKFKMRHKMKPIAKHIFCANELPRISETNNSLYRRLNILKFEAKFTDEDKKCFDIKKLLTQEAIDYLAFISLQEYLKLLEIRKFANEEESEKIVNSYRIENSSVLEYITNTSYLLVLLKKYNNVIPRELLYEDYKCFCKKARYRAKGRNTFYSEIESTGLFTNVTIMGNRRFKYIGTTNRT